MEGGKQEAEGGPGGGGEGDQEAENNGGKEGGSGTQGDYEEGEVRRLDSGYGYGREQHDGYAAHDTHAISEEDRPGLLLGAPKGHAGEGLLGGQQELRGSLTIPLSHQSTH